MLLAHSFCQLIAAHATRQIEAAMEQKKGRGVGEKYTNEKKIFSVFLKELEKKLLLFYFSGRTS